MDGYNKAYKLRTKYDINNILETIDCHKSNPKYDNYREQLNKLIETYIDCMKPMGYVVEDTINKYLPASCLKSLYCMVSLGDAIDQVISTCFANYEYLEGMMMNTLADQVLFEATNHLFEILKEEQSEKALHLTIRYEPGNMDIPMSVQKDIFDKIIPEFNLDMMISEGYMLTPTKSITYLYGISKEDCSMGLDHDCSSCDSIKCPHRKYVIKVHKSDNLEVIQAKKGENLLEVLRRHNVYIDANIKCGMGSIGGAICEIKQEGKSYGVKTLGDVDPIGICGSALIDAISLLHKEGYIDDRGFMSEPVMIYDSIGIFPEECKTSAVSKSSNYGWY